ncbi:cysteine--tRNA ligase [archaeon CG10_big_fil_rev_8_21_14_0_10_43_11]|nr:MAG: cysteine--tRNA ligase [archaeon CG10_big_fil_rev_8_21_14_0_10_43_11]
MALKIFNSLTRKLEDFKPLKKGRVGLYSCGPTVYNYAHLGNLRAYVFVDTLKRTLLYNNYHVTHVMNITDVGHLTSDADTGEDKMEVAKARERKSAWDIALFYEKEFFHDIGALNILDPDIVCRATDHIKEQIDMVKKIEKKDYTYCVEDGIYFDTSKLKTYGELGGINKKKLKAGARVELIEGKKNPADFALWKFSPKDAKRDMEWESPWGRGFPGWHIECSAMSTKYLGNTFDIHTGGIDHLTVHHPNEIAQAEAANGVAPVRVWMHNEHLHLKEGKMSKSTGSGFILNTLIKKGYDPLDYRYLLLTASYRKQLSFTWEALENAKKTRERLKNIITDLQTELKGTISKPYKQAFLKAINNDLDTPKALALMWKLIRDKNIKDKDKLALLYDFDSVLALGMRDMAEEHHVLPGEVQDIIDKRDSARKEKDWKKADMLRDKLIARGYHVDDTPQGTRVKKC